jgi:hypothetical protein
MKVHMMCEYAVLHPLGDSLLLHSVVSSKMISDKPTYMERMLNMLSAASKT